MYLHRLLAALVLLGIVAGLGSAQEPPLRTATIQWIADTPQLTYDVRFGGEGSTMPTALKTLLRDLADSEGLYLTGEDKTKTIASQNRRIFLEYASKKSKVKVTRINKIELKETPGGVDFLVSFAKKPSDEDLTRIDGVLEIFARKYKKAAKSATATVLHADTPVAGAWPFEVRFKDAKAKDKK